MGFFSVFAGAIGALLLAIVSVGAENRASSTSPDEVLDRDSFKARLAWLADITALAAAVINTCSSLVQQWRLGSSSQALMVCLVVVSLVALAALLYTAAAGSHANFVNRYPESTYQKLSRDRWAGPERLQWLPPGVMMSAVLSATVAIATVAAAKG